MIKVIMFCKSEWYIPLIKVIMFNKSEILSDWFSVYKVSFSSRDKIKKLDHFETFEPIKPFLKLCSTIIRLSDYEFSTLQRLKKKLEFGERISNHKDRTLVVFGILYKKTQETSKTGQVSKKEEEKMVSLETSLALELPVIDFTSPNLKPGTVEWDSVRGEVRKSLEDYGCFEALFDKVPVKLRKAVFDASEEAFRLPLETKQRVVSRRKYRGYVGQIPTLPLFEVLGVDFAENEAKVNEFTHKLWPQGNTSFRFRILKLFLLSLYNSLGFKTEQTLNLLIFSSESVMSFTEKLSELDLMTRRMIMESFGVNENYIENHLKSTKFLMRLMKYQGVEETEEALGMEAHTDRNMLTILVRTMYKTGSK